jgi:hypothetical protein
VDSLCLSTPLATLLGLGAAGQATMPLALASLAVAMGWSTTLLARSF